MASNNTLPAEWSARFGIGAAALTAVAVSDSAGPFAIFVYPLSFVLMVLTGFDAVVGLAADRRSTKRRDASTTKLRVVGLCGALAAAALWTWYFTT